jgi:hypothetical protein
MLVAWSVDMASNLGDNGSSECNVWHKMTVHDIHLAAKDLELASCFFTSRGILESTYMEPIRSVSDCIRAFFSKFCEIRGKDGRSDNCGRRHVQEIVQRYADYVVRNYT